MKNILTSLFTNNNFAMLNVTGQIGMGKHFNITEASNSLGYKTVTILTSSIDTDLDLSKYNNNDTKIVLVLEDLDRASDTVINNVSKGILNNKLFNLDLDNVVVVITTVDTVDFDMPVLARSIVIENR